MAKAENFEGLALIAHEMGSEIIRGPVRYSGGEDGPRSLATLVEGTTETEAE